MKTYMAKKQEMIDSRKDKWFIVDAENMVLGRLASELAVRLRGKHKPEYTPHVDCGDQIIVINADKVHVSGKKMTDKLYHRHTGYPGGIKSPSYEKVIERHPTKPLESAVKGMLPKGPLGRDMLRKLRLYAGTEHNHAAQHPTDITSEFQKFKAD
jgi:large subunit ribosomal protein L13